MIRHSVTPRPNWQAKLERLGFDYHSLDGNYWQEDSAYQFNEAEITTLEDATTELHQLCMETVANIIKCGDYERLGLDQFASRLIEQSWRQCQPTLYGRFDLVYHNQHTPPKLLEYNADTPTTLFEASVAQWYWLQDNFPQADQFNGIHEHLITQWQLIFEQQNQQNLSNTAPNKFTSSPPTIVFATITDSIEDTVTCRYLQDTAIQAGFRTHFMDLRDLGWQTQTTSSLFSATPFASKLSTQSTGYFVDQDDNQVEHLFKLYPWEWLLSESFAKYLLISDIQWLEPAWKMLLSNKAILPILWERFPNHPNLLPCYFEKDKAKLSRHHLPHGVVKKPVFSREGANISLLNANLNQVQMATTGDYATNNGGWIYQACQPLPQFHNQVGKAVYPVIGSWVIGHVSAGISIREDDSLITKNTSHFVPHYFYP